MGLGKYFNGGNLMQVALALSLMRPDSQSYIGQPYPTAAELSNGGPYNMTNSVFNPVAMSPGATLPTTDRIWAAKEAAMANSQNPLSRFLDLHVNPNQFDNDAVAMLFEGEPCRTPSRRSVASESESGYNSEGVPSPSASSSPEPCSDMSEFGATGFTLPSSTTTENQLNGVLDLDDFLDLNVLESAVKAEPLSPVFDEGITDMKTQPLSRCTSGSDLYFDESKCLDEVIDLHPSSFDFDFDALYGPPFGVDPTIDGQNFADGANIDDLDLEFNFPPDILSPVGTESNQNQDLLSQVITGSPELHSRTGSPALSDLSLEETFPDNRFLYNPSAADTRVLKAEPSKISELSSLSPELAKKAAKDSKGARPKVSAPRVPRLPVSDSKLIELPVNDFNDLIAKLNEEEGQYARDVRRRGKNKEAARLCRKRKIEAIDGLDDELRQLKDEKVKILEERRKLQEETRFWKTKVGELEGYIFKSLIDENGQPLSPSEYSLFQGSNGNVYVGKDINAKRPSKT